jgi:hypothetical protein
VQDDIRKEFGTLLIVQQRHDESDTAPFKRGGIQKGVERLSLYFISEQGNPGYVNKKGPT